MRILFALIGLLGFSLSATAEKGWLFYDNYPWVYDNITQDWLYLKPHTNGKLYAYRHSTNLWEEFSAHKHKTWDELYEEWVQNPEPYGGLSVLQRIKEAKDSGATSLILNQENITDLTPLAGLTNLTELLIPHNNNNSDLTPLAGLTNLTELWIGSNNISDLSPLAGLTNLVFLGLDNNNISDITPLVGLSNLTELWLQGNNISVSQKAMLEAALPNTSISWPDVIIEDWYLDYEEWIQNPEPYGGLSVLQQIKQAKDSGASELLLSSNNITDLTPLAGLTNLTTLWLYGNNITDLTPLAELTNLTKLNLSFNNITDLTPLAGLTNLWQLYLYQNNIGDLTPLAGLTNLEELDLPNNNISDLTPLAGLANLALLDLSSNNISDITPLEGLTNLHTLELEGHNISDSQKAMLEEALPNTNIYW